MRRWPFRWSAGVPVGRRLRARLLWASGSLPPDPYQAGTESPPYAESEHCDHLATAGRMRHRVNPSHCVTSRRECRSPLVRVVLSVSEHLDLGAVHVSALAHQPRHLEASAWMERIGPYHGGKLSFCTGAVAEFAQRQRPVVAHLEERA